MNFLANTNTVLLIADEETLTRLSSFCASVLSGEGTKIQTASTGLNGILAYHRFLPCIVIVYDDLPDMRGCSVCSIIRDSAQGMKMANIFFVGDSSSYLYNTFADFFFQKPLQLDLLGTIFKEFFYRRRTSSPEFLGQIGSAARKQRMELPKPIDTPHCFVSNFFSAYSELSGDGLDYWFDNGKPNLYGFIFDNSGHDLLAYSEASAIRTMLKFTFSLYQTGMIPTLGKILYQLNNNLFTASDNDPPTVAAILFHISFEKNTLSYAPAGMPCIYADYGDGLLPVRMKSPPVGALRNVEYENYSLPLGGIQRVLFVSDGMEELLTIGDDNDSPPFDDIAKHDDVSGVMVDIKQGESCNFK